MTSTVPNTLALGLFFALCSNALLFVVVLLQWRSGLEHGSVGGCGDVALEFRGRGRGDGLARATDGVGENVFGADVEKAYRVNTGQISETRPLDRNGDMSAYINVQEFRALKHESFPKHGRTGPTVKTREYFSEHVNSDGDQLSQRKDQVAASFQGRAERSKSYENAFTEIEGEEETIDNSQTSTSSFLKHLTARQLFKKTLQRLSSASDRIAKLSKSYLLFRNQEQQPKPRTDAIRTRFEAKFTPVSNQVEIKTSRQSSNNLPAVETKDKNTIQISREGHHYKNKTAKQTGNLNSVDFSTDKDRVAFNSRQRRRRETGVNASSSGGDPQTQADVILLEEVFPTFTDDELKKFSPPVAEILMPALIHFEGMMVRQVEMLNDAMVSLDLRLENLENAKLDWENGVVREPQSDAEDNKTDLDSVSQVIEENFIPVGNASELLEIDGDHGSGEVDIKIEPTKPPTTTPYPVQVTTSNAQFLEMYHHLQTVEQKVMALENYNVMSDSELKRTRSEVIKMDDKVTEMDRRQRNLQVRTSMQMYRVTELEVFMAKAELALHTTLDAFSRMGGRLDAFKDRLAQYNNELHSVTVEFGRQNQITNELRAADSYKAHDINEIRKNMMNLEGRLNGFFRQIDQNSDTLRNDVRSMLDRLCSNNDLTC